MRLIEKQAFIRDLESSVTVELLIYNNYYILEKHEAIDFVRINVFVLGLITLKNNYIDKIYLNNNHSYL